MSGWWQRGVRMVAETGIVGDVKLVAAGCQDDERLREMSRF